MLNNSTDGVASGPWRHRAVFRLTPFPYTSHDMRWLRVRGPVVAASILLGIGAAIGAVSDEAVGALHERIPEQLPRAEELQRLLVIYDDGAGRVRRTDRIAYAGLDDIRDTNGDPTAVAAFGDQRAVLGSGIGGRRVQLRGVSSEFWTVMGVHAVQGRVLDAEDARGVSDVIPAVAMEGVVLSAGSPDSSLLGREFEVGTLKVRVVGVLSRGAFRGVAEPADLYVPLETLAPTVAGNSWRVDADRAWLRVIVRVPRLQRPDARAQEIAVRLSAGALRVSRLGPPSRVELVPVRSGFSPGNQRQRLLPVSSTVIALLLRVLAVCSAAGLLLLHAFNRQRELRIRIALGATPIAAASGLWRDLMLVTSISLTSAVIVAGGLASAAGALVQAVSVTAHDVRTSYAVAGACLSAFLMLAGAAVPALAVSLRIVSSTYRAPTLGTSFARGRLLRTQSWVVIAQTAILFVLLVGTVGATSAYRLVADADLGIRSDSVVIVSVEPRAIDRRTWDGTEVLNHAQTVVTRLPAVKSTAVALGAPFLSATAMAVFTDDPEMTPSEGAPIPFFNAVSHDFFATLGASIVKGRPFLPTDLRGAERVAVVNSQMATTYWPRGDALGACVYLAERAAPCARIVGIVADLKRFSLLSEPPHPQLYVPLPQNPSPELVPLVLLVRTAKDPRVSAGEVRRAILQTVPGFPFADVDALDTVIDPQLRPWRLGARISSVFAILAWIVAALGAFALGALQVSMRSRELAVRAAVGAAPARLIGALTLGGVFRAAIALIIGGGLLVVGIPQAMTLLPKLPLHWGMIVGISALLVLLTSAIANLVSAARVTRLNPTSALAAPAE